MSEHEQSGNTAEPSNPKQEYHQIEYVVQEQPKKRSLARRIGCGFLLVIWLFILLLPLGFFILAVDGEITLSHRGDVPEKHAHPRLQVRLITEIDYRGLQITNTSVNRADDLNLCIQTDVRYLLWQGEGEPATYCDCYLRSDQEEDWQFDTTNPGQCE